MVLRYTGMSSTGKKEISVHRKLTIKEKEEIIHNVILSVIIFIFFMFCIGCFIIFYKIL